VTDEEVKAFRDLVRQLRALREGDGERPEQPEPQLDDDDRLQLENPYYSPHRVEGSWQTTTR